MGRVWIFALVLGITAAGSASSQVFPPDLQKYLSLTDAQAKSISDLNNQFGQYTNTQQAQYYYLQSQASAEMSKDAPDAGTIGADYAQMEMIRRDYNNQLAQVRSKIAAVLTTDQAALVNALLNAVRLQPLVSEAVCVHLATFQRQGDFSNLLLGTGTVSSYVLSTPCQVPPMPTALANYLSLTDAQIAAIENAILGNQDYASRQALNIAQIQNYIRDLTAAETIDSAALGAAYLAIVETQRDVASQTIQLTTSVRSMLTDPQQKQLQALDNAMNLSLTANQAVGTNVLVLPPDLQCSMGWYSAPGFIYNSGPVGGVLSPPLGSTCGLTGVIGYTGDFSSL